MDKQQKKQTKTPVHIDPVEQVIETTPSKKSTRPDEQSGRNS